MIKLLSIVFMILGIFFILSSFSQYYDKDCNNDISIKFVPRDVYDEIIKNKKL